VLCASWWRSLVCIQSTVRSWNSVLTLARTWQKTQTASRKFIHLDFEIRVVSCRVWTSCTVYWNM
jgi:hypothetical protein